MNMIHSNNHSSHSHMLIPFYITEWREEEVGRINSELTGAERKAALCQLLEQETQLIASVGRHKLEADGDNRKLIVQKFLDKVRVINICKDTGSPLHRETENGPKKIHIRENTGNFEILPKHKEFSMLKF